MTDKKDAPEEIKEEELEAAAEKVEEEVEVKEVQATEEAEPEAAPEEETPAAAPAPAPEGPKKGLMQRRKSFAQSSVPNAHRGYNPKTPVVMLGIIFVMLVASFILASVAG